MDCSRCGLPVPDRRTGDWKRPDVHEPPEDCLEYLKQEVRRLGCHEAEALLRMKRAEEEAEGLRAWCLLAAIQLACRHPNFKGATRRITEQAARRLQDALLPKGSALAEVAERGWHEEYDVAWPERARGK